MAVAMSWLDVKLGFRMLRKYPGLTLAGVVPEGFAFPVNHRLWVPLQLRASGYAPLEGAGIRVFGRLSGDATQAQANAELAAVVARAAVLVVVGVAAGNIVLLLVVGLSDEDTVSQIWSVLLITSAVMLAVGLLACVEPAWRALRINPTDALKEVC